jgi:hypothetical protein
LQGVGSNNRDYRFFVLCILVDTFLFYGNYSVAMIDFCFKTFEYQCFEQQLFFYIGEKSDA